MNKPVSTTISSGRGILVIFWMRIEIERLKERERVGGLAKYEDEIYSTL
jgi:hypothetical protein